MRPVGAKSRARPKIRDAHSYEYYNRETGIAVYISPVVKPDAFFLYFDPLWRLSADVQARWQDEVERKKMKAEAIEAAGR